MANKNKLLFEVTKLYQLDICLLNCKLNSILATKPEKKNK